MRISSLYNISTLRDGRRGKEERKGTVKFASPTYLGVRHLKLGAPYQQHTFSCQNSGKQARRGHRAKT